MKKVFKLTSLVFVLAVILSFFTVTVGASTYPSEDYWATEALNAAVKNEILYGKGNGNLDPEANLTRAEMAAIIVRAFGANITTDISRFSDVSSSQWYYDYVAKAVHMGAFVGDANNTMRPDDSILREEAFTVLARVLVLSSSDYSSLNRFTDSWNISDWAKEYLSILAKKGYVNGNQNREITPKDNITRAEFVQFMHNIFKTYLLTAGTYSDIGPDSTLIRDENINLSNVTIPGDLVIGDGANLSTITLTNVKIQGRLLVRGAATVKFVNVAVGEDVVVKNINSNVHFDNYRNESVFKNINIITSATFKQSYGGGGGGGSVTPSYNVTFYYNDTIKAGNPINVKSGNKITSEQLAAKKTEAKNQGKSTTSYEGYVKNSSVSDVYSSTDYMDIVEYDWWYYDDGNQEWIVFDENIEITEDMDVYLKVKRLSIDAHPSSGSGYKFEIFYNDKTRALDSFKNLMYTQFPEGLRSSNLNLIAIKNGIYNLPQYDATIQKLIDKNIIDKDGNILNQEFMVRFSQVLGEENVEKFIVDSAKEQLDGSNEELIKEFVKYFDKMATSTDPSDRAYIKDMLNKSIIYTNQEQHIKDYAEQHFSKDFLISLGFTVTEAEYITKDAFLTWIDNNTNEVVSKVVDYIVDNDDVEEIDNYAHLVVQYLDNHRETKDTVVDSIIELNYRTELDQLVYEVKNYDKFTVTEKTIFIANGLKTKLLKDYSFDSIIANVPQTDKLFKIYPEQKLRNIYEIAFGNLTGQVTDAINKLKNGASTEEDIDCGLTFNINPVDDVYVPLYESLSKQLKSGKVGEILKYNESDYLPELVELISVETLFDDSIKDTKHSGYKLQGFDYYYNLALNALILSDDAVAEYKTLYTKEEIDEILLAYEDLAIKYANRIADFLDGYANGTKDPSNKYFTAVEEVIKSKFGELYNKVLDWYKDSPLNKKYTSDDYKLFRDKVKEAYDKIDMPTDGIYDDEYIDKVLSKLDNIDKIVKKKDQPYYSEYDSVNYEHTDIYEITVKGKTLTFVVVSKDMYEILFEGNRITITRELSN